MIEENIQDHMDEDLLDNTGDPLQSLNIFP